MFRDVLVCSGMIRDVPGFIDAPFLSLCLSVQAIDQSLFKIEPIKLQQNDFPANFIDIK